MPATFNVEDFASVDAIAPSFSHPPPKTMPSHDTPIVLDHGAFQCRAGWASDDPQPSMVFRNVVCKSKDKATNQNALFVGNQTLALNAAERLSGRSACDQKCSVIVHPEILENVFDYTFASLGCNSDSVHHPVVMTETICTPGASRQLVSELLFECYNVPSVAYGVDALFSYYYNAPTLEDSIIISSGHHATYLIPFVNGRMLVSECKRIGLGGADTAEAMLKLLQLKYPHFPVKVTPEQAQAIIQTNSYVAEDYCVELKKYQDFDFLDENDHIIQFPYTMLSPEKSAEELEEIERRKEENRQRMREQALRQRQEKLEKKQLQLDQLKTVLELKPTMDLDDFKEQLSMYGLKNETELNNEIKTLQTSIDKIKNKMMGIETPEEPKEVPTFPLVDIPDDQLTLEQRHEKKKQKLLKAGYDARERARKEKEEKKRRQEEEERREEERRVADPEGWIKSIRQKRQDLLNQVKEREKAKKEAETREAARARMRTIAALASEENLTTSGSKRKRQKKDDDDTFGANDDDWAVYREIKHGSDDEDEEADDLTVQIEYYTNLLITHDPLFSPEDSLSLENRHKSLFYRFRYGPKGYIDEGDVAGQSQIHLNVERCRVAEYMFQPSIFGLDRAGVVECLESASKRLGGVQNVYLTGGHTKYEGILERLTREVRMMLPVDSPFRVFRAKDPLLDSWKGAAKWAHNIVKQKEAAKYFLSRADYQEMGGDYLKEHSFSNKFYRLT